MTAPRITLYLDIVSPFGYIAFHVLRVGVLGSISIVSTNRYEELPGLCQVQCQLRPYLPGGSHEHLWKHTTH